MKNKDVIALALRGEISNDAAVDYVVHQPKVFEMGGDSVKGDNARNAGSGFSIPGLPMDQYPDSAFAWVGPDGHRDYLHHHDDVRIDADGSFDHNTVVVQLCKAGLAKVEGDKHLTPAARAGVKSHLLYHLAAIDSDPIYQTADNLGGMGEVDFGAPVNQVQRMQNKDVSYPFDTKALPRDGAYGAAERTAYPTNDPVVPPVNAHLIPGMRVVVDGTRALDAQMADLIGRRHRTYVYEDLKLGDDETLDDFMDGLRGAVRTRFGTDTYTAEVFSKFVVVGFYGDDSRSGQYVKVEYDRDSKGKFTLAEKEQTVDRRVVFVPAKVSEAVENPTAEQRKDLPDAAYAIVEKRDGRTIKKLPHHTKDVKKATEDGTVDLPRLRNALARGNQVKGVSANKKKAGLAHIEGHANRLLKARKEKRGETHTDKSGEDLLRELWVEIELRP